MCCTNRNFDLIVPDKPLIHTDKKMHVTSKFYVNWFSVSVWVLNQLLANIAKEAVTIFKCLFFAKKYCNTVKCILLLG